MSETLRALPPTLYPFTGLAAGTTQTIIVCQRIAVHHVTEIDVLLRFHTGTVITTPGAAGATQWMIFSILSDANTEDDPTVLFTTSLKTFQTPATAMTVPSLQVISVSATGTLPFGRFIALSVFANQGVAAALACNISIDVVLKGAGATSGGGGSRGYLGYGY